MKVKKIQYLCQATLELTNMSILPIGYIPPEKQEKLLQASHKGWTTQGERKAKKTKRSGKAYERLTLKERLLRLLRFFVKR